jgi:hypothetical protein
VATLSPQKIRMGEILLLAFGKKENFSPKFEVSVDLWQIFAPKNKDWPESLLSDN